MEEELINFIISAPGRIVLSGEDTAVYGKHLVVAALDIRTKLEFRELSEAEGKIIKIDFNRVALQKDIFLEDVERYFFQTNLSEIYTNPIRFLRYVTYFITTHGLWSTHEQKFSLQMFFYLFYSMTYDLERKPFYVHVSTKLPPGSGLGSSTSFAVCLAACFLHWRCLQGGHHISFNNEELMTIKRYSESCKDVMQEDVFPWVDAEICIHGKIRSHQHTHYKSLLTSIINLQKVIKILIVPTTKEQSKKIRADKMAHMKVCNSEFDSIINLFDEIAKSIYDRLDNINNNSNANIFPSRDYYDLQKDIARNQQLLNKYRLSPPAFNVVGNIAKIFGYGAKQTSFGGKFAYIVLQPDITDATIDCIKQVYQDARIMTRVATIDCEGVKIDNS
ncbi:mevalonate kinase-like isoform X1 [Nylanderia fulva]|uniref:mevalonate kinase-like isoform X1 n=1 Tax=Nylanderia fulva TaxID=613905 RepID=UPI0010FB2D7D|nr:mevalonate kinase-like isoform X1 [Nylanderia fulva]